LENTVWCAARLLWRVRLTTCNSSRLDSTLETVLERPDVQQNQVRVISLCRVRPFEPSSSRPGSGREPH
jgi:hypothetical protein